MAPTSRTDGGPLNGPSRESTVGGTAVVFGLASLLTAIVAWPVVQSPTRVIFGREIVGRHHDPFTVMYQMAGSGPPMPYVQPVTDWTGWLLARVLDPVAAYNVLVLLTFPLAAAATYALARYLRLQPAAAIVAALFFALAPMHVAQAAYHPHVAQTQWLPLYLLALFSMIDRPGFGRALGLAAATGALVLSNFYMGLIGAVLTPVALAGYWWAHPRGPRELRPLGITAGWLATLVMCGMAVLAVAYPQVLQGPSIHQVSIAEIPVYSARPWAYLTPPVTHPTLGPFAAAVLDRAGITVGLVEQQVYVGISLLVLAVVGGLTALARWHTRPERRPLLVLWGMAAAAMLVSIGPTSGACTPESWAPACRLYAVVPMFRAYARFAVVVHLAVALCAGAGLAWLARGARAHRIAAVGLLLLAVFEYWPLPAQARDVLPTQAHRWLAGGAATWRTLDCVPPEPALQLVPWLMGQQIDPLGVPIRSCRDRYLGQRLSALGYTHLLIREPDHSGAQRLLDAPDAGLTPVATFPDSRVYAVTAALPPVATIADEGFFEYEYAGSGVWRWMGSQGRWRVRNTTGTTGQVSLSVDLESVRWPRQVEVTLDGRPAAAMRVGTMTERHVLGPWTLAPGDHDLVFTALGEAIRPSDYGPSGDDRPLTVAFWRQAWTEMPERTDVPDDRAR